jgi:hypothetical protein
MYTPEDYKKMYARVKITQDFIDILENPAIDYFSFLESITEPTQDKPFWIAAKVTNPALDDITWKQNNPLIKNNELHTDTMVPSEYEKLKNSNMGNGYDRCALTESHHELIKLLGFREGYSAYINNQPSGAQMYRHIDSISCYTYENSDRDIMNAPFDKQLKQPHGSMPIYRCFVALDDWYPGQMFIFNDTQIWSHWKKGDVMFFDWRHAYHATANCGFKDRPLLKITGVVDDDSYILNAKENNQIVDFVF